MTEWKVQEFPMACALPSAEPPPCQTPARSGPSWASASSPEGPLWGQGPRKACPPHPTRGQPGARLRGRMRGALCPTVLAYMQLLEDYSEPQPSVFYQTPQNEHIYQQKNKLLMEVYGFSDSFSTGSDSLQELAPPPALPPKQRQLVSPTPQPWPCRCARASNLPGLGTGRVLLGCGLWQESGVGGGRCVSMWALCFCSVT